MNSLALLLLLSQLIRSSLPFILPQSTHITTSLHGDLFSRRAKSSSPSPSPSQAPPKTNINNDVFTVQLNRGIMSPGLGYSTNLSFRNVYISSIEESSPFLNEVEIGDLIVAVNDGEKDVSTVDMSFDQVMNVLNGALLNNDIIKSGEGEGEGEGVASQVRGQ
jgi:hypothetical protein